MLRTALQAHPSTLLSPADPPVTSRPASARADSYLRPRSNKDFDDVESTSTSRRRVPEEPPAVAKSGSGPLAGEVGKRSRASDPPAASLGSGQPLPSLGPASVCRAGQNGRSGDAWCRPRVLFRTASFGPQVVRAGAVLARSLVQVNCTGPRHGAPWGAYVRFSARFRGC